jgi:hypothetical protein
LGRVQGAAENGALINRAAALDRLSPVAFIGSRALCCACFELENHKTNTLPGEDPLEMALTQEEIIQISILIEELGPSVRLADLLAEKLLQELEERDGERSTLSADGQDLYAAGYDEARNRADAYSDLQARLQVIPAFKKLESAWDALRLKKGAFKSSAAGRAA